MTSSPEQQRQSQRKFFKTHALAIYQGRQLTVVTADISLGGMAIIGDYNLQSGASLTLSFNLPDVKHSGHVFPVSIQGVVVYCAFSASVNGFKAGIQFISMDAPSKNALTQYLE